jgi:hypothetical protein
MRRVVQLALSERDLRAGARVLRELLHNDHPSVQLYVTRALADCGKHHALGCVVRMEAALLAPAESRWCRIKAGILRWVERNIICEYPGQVPSEAGGSI